MKKKNLLKGLAVLGLTATASVGLASCGSETAKVENIIPMVNYQGAAETVKLSDVVATATDTYTREQIDEYIAAHKNDSVTHTFYYENVTSIKSYAKVMDFYWEYEDDIDESYNHIYNYTTGLTDRDNTFRAGKKYLISMRESWGDSSRFYNLLEKYIGENFIFELPLNREPGTLNENDSEYGTINKAANALNIYVNNGFYYITFTPEKDIVFQKNGDDCSGNYEDNQIGADFDVYELEMYDESERVQPVYPDFDNVDINIPVNANYPVSIADILKGIHANDDTDGNISDRVELVSTTYDPANPVVGSHDFNVKVSDTAGNVTTATFKVTVYDIEDPVITAVNKTVGYNTPLSTAEINALFTYNDNFGTPAFEIVNNTYTASSSKKGVYQISARVTDTAGNTSIATSTITVVDKLAPVITAPASYTNVATSQCMSENEMRSKIKVVDGYDGEITDYTIRDVDNYSKNYKIVGTYKFVITAKDQAGNTSTFNYTIETSDTIAPDFWVYSDFVITLTKGETITKEQIVSFLSQLGEIDAANVQSVVYDESVIEAGGSTDVTVNMLDGSSYRARLSVVENADEPEVESNWFGNYINGFKKFSTWGVYQWLTVITGGLLLVAIATFTSKKKK